MAARSVLTIHPHSFGATPRDARARPLARPQGGAVIRLPDRLSAPYAALIPKSTPRLYVHEGARQALERRLTAASPVPVSLSITDNTHSMISHSWHGGVLRARVHHMFLDAPPNIQTALVRYVTEADRESSIALGTFIDARSDRLAKRARARKIVTSGKHHDLLRIFGEVNDRYFGGQLDCLVSWGRRVKRTHAHRQHGRSAIKLGSYHENERLIRIHPALDRPWVPRYFVAFIVFHEMLHHVIPARRGERRRELHPPEFREREATFRFYERALAWERKNLRRLLKS